MSNLDLNLLAVFDAIMSEGSITKAASKVGMTQPAVSNAVSRMRLVWNDPLFIKSGRGIKPTPKAEALWQQFRQPLLDIRQIATNKKFDVKTSDRIFRLGITEPSVDMILRPLRSVLETEASQIRIHSVPIYGNAEEMLSDASIDIAVDFYAGNLRKIHSSRLFSNKLVCVVHRDHRLLKTLDANGKVPLKQYLLEDHLIVSLSGEPQATVDDVLTPLGVKRKIAMTVNYFSSIPAILKDSNLVCVTPQSVVASSVRNGELRVVPLSFDIEPAPISLLWHDRQDRDTGNMWMRQLISKVTSTETAKLASYFS